ncbi:MAG: hypothetical protein LBJ67_19270 [Planctomycetaceae bacterium]|nr:hypothetical protein [Planctomycetaceae bacterium]
MERTGGGLMVELGNRQLDAANIFLTAQQQPKSRISLAKCIRFSYWFRQNAKYRGDACRHLMETLP